MKKIIPSLIVFGIIAGGLVGCGNKSNAIPPKPLVEFTPTLQAKYIWDSNIGNGNANQVDLKLTPSVYNNTIYTSSFDGYITAVDAKNGRQKWSINTKLQLSSPVAVNANTVIAGSLRGELIAVSTKNGKILWASSLPSSLFSKPTIKANVVYVQTHDGSVSAYDISDGKQIWSEKIPTPDLMLIGNSSPVAYKDLILVGTSSGSLWGFKLATGEKLWDNPVALPQSGSQSQQMVDITATPLIDNDTLYIATFQGNLISFDTKVGGVNWQKKASIYNNMSIGNGLLFVTNSDSDLVVYNINNGNIVWQKDTLEGRKLSAPLYYNGNVYVGDFEGYLHIFNAKSGKYLDRLEIGGDGISAQPISVNHQIIVQTNDGTLAAIKP